MKSLVEELSAAQMGQVRIATEDILENVGFKVKHKGLRQRCRAVGAMVDEVRENVRLPAPLLREVLVAQYPDRFRWPEAQLGLLHVPECRWQQTHSLSRWQ